MLKSALLPRYECATVTPQLRPLYHHSTRWCN